MKMESDSGVGLTPELLHSKRTSRAVNGRAVATPASSMRESVAVLPESGRVHDHTPVSSIGAASFQ